MSYYPDLSRYVHSKGFATEKSLNIGWLTKEEPFQTGDTSQSFLDNLQKFCEVTFLLTRGFHLCDICSGAGTELNKAENYIQAARGSAEIRVIGEGGKIYCTPNLIFHYIDKHNYLPPEEFIAAVMNGPFPDDEAYISFFDKLGAKFDPPLTY